MYPSVNIRVPPVAFLFAAALLLQATPAGAARTDRRSTYSCGRKHEHVLLADARAVVYEKEATVFGCAYGRKRAYELGLNAQSSSGGSEVNVRAIKGVLVAYEAAQVSRTFEPQAAVPETRMGTLVVRNLRNGRSLFEAEGGAVSAVLKRDGSVAWIAQSGKGSSATYEVRAHDRSGESRLAQGGNVDPQSLRLTGSTIHWTQGGASFSAVLH